MNRTSSLNASIESIIEIARLAPSVHNSQPWLVVVNHDVVTVKIDSAHKLKDGDPTGRQTVLSLGIFTEALCIAAESLGFCHTSIQFKNGEATVKLRELKKINPNIYTLVGLLKSRATDRSIYEHIALSDKTVRSLSRHSLKLGKTKIWILRDKNSLERIADWTAHGIGVAMSSESFRLELSHLMVGPWSKRRRGISTSSLYIPHPLSDIEPWLVRLGIGLNSEVKLEKRRWLSASADVLITTQGDMPEYWFAAGRTYLRVSLAIENEGLSQATSAATVEASNFHEDVEKLLGTNQRLQAVIRIGKGSEKRFYSPRVSAKDIITSR